MRQSRRRYAASAKAKLQATDINYLGHKTRTMLACLGGSDWPATTFAFSYPAMRSIHPSIRLSILLSIRNPSSVMALWKSRIEAENGNTAPSSFPPTIALPPPLWLAPLSRVCKSVIPGKQRRPVSTNSAPFFRWKGDRMIDDNRSKTVTFPFPRENIDFWQLSREILSTRRQTREVNVERFDIFVTQPLLQRLQSMLHSAINAPTNLGQQFILPQRCHSGCIPATVVPRYCYTSNNKSSIWQRSFSNQWERVKRRVYFANIAFYISKRGRKGKKWDRDRTLGT